MYLSSFHERLWLWGSRSQARAWPGRPGLKQWRTLADFERPQEPRAVNKAQWKGPRLFAFQHRFLAERVDTGGDADIGVLFDHLAEPGNRSVQCAEQVVDVLGLDARCDAIERRL